MGNGECALRGCGAGAQLRARAGSGDSAPSLSAPERPQPLARSARGAVCAASSEEQALFLIPGPAGCDNP